MLRKVTHCAGRISANTRPHQLRWGDREMGTAISCKECSQVAGLIHKLAQTPQKHCLFVQLYVSHSRPVTLPGSQYISLYQYMHIRI